MGRVELLYPARKRCRRCRKFFSFTVVQRLFCSRECAGLPEISSDPKDWPRQHFKRVYWSGQIKEKVAFTKKDAEEQARLRKKDAYLCDYCEEWHIGSKKPEEAK